MIIKQLDNVHSQYKSTLPIYTDLSGENIRVVHGVTDNIKISEIKENKIREITSIKDLKLNYFRSIIFEDIDGDGNKELLFVDSKDNINIYRLTNNNLNSICQVNFKSKLSSSLREESLQIKVIRVINNSKILFGTNCGLIFYKIKKIREKFDFEYYKSIIDKDIWECKIDYIEPDLNELLIIGLEDKIIILDSELQEILKQNTSERIYDIKIFDIDKCGKKELLISTKQGNLIIYKIKYTNGSPISINEFYSEKLINKDECYRNNPPAINTFFIQDLNCDGKNNIIIGGNDNKINIFEWDSTNSRLIKIEESTLPKDEVYSIDVFIDENHNLILLYSTFMEEISLNHLITYFTGKSEFALKIIQSIAERIYTEPDNFCFFLGAGFSYNDEDPMKSTPLAKDLIKELFSEYNFSIYDLPTSLYRNSLEYIFYYLKKLYPKKNFKKFIEDRFNKKFQETKSIKLLSQLVDLGIIKQIFTVNWDTLLEDAIKDKINIYYKHSDLKLSNINTPFYIKLHGTSRDLDSIIASIDETEISEHNYSLMIKRNFLKLYYDTVNFVFIGYSFNDRDFIDIFRDKLYNNEINIYIFDPNPNENMFNIIENRIFIYKQEKHYFHIFKCKSKDFFDTFFTTIERLIENS